jgi:hypothetical protein
MHGTAGILALCISLAFISGCGGRSMSSDTFVISVTYPSDKRGFSEILRIDATGSVELTCESSTFTPDSREIGLYGGSVAEDQAEELKDSLLMLEKRGLPPREPMPPGSDLVVISLQQDEQITERRIDPHASSPAICKVAERFETIKKACRENPVRVVAMTCSLSGNSVNRQRTLSVEVRLSAQGEEPVKIHAPVGKTEETGGLSVRAVRSDLPVEEIWPQHTKHLILTEQMLSASDGPTPDDAGLLGLAPGESASYSFDFPVDWEAGRYDLRVLFETLASGQDVLKGIITSPPTTVEVLK